MARYMAIIDVTAAAFKGLIQSPQDRKEATTTLFSSIGGEVEHYWFGIGSNTLYIVINAPENDVNMEALSMLVFGSGIAQSMNMVKLMCSDEAVAAMKKAGELAYDAPSN
tara:strand:+ start:1099 stop:1428 length:330 start_codon:yes stop_codon:yes gene_type:complete